MSATIQQCVFGTNSTARANALRQARALTQWARRTGVIGPTIHATDAERYRDLQWGHGYCEWMAPAEGVVELLRGNPVTISFVGRLRAPVGGLVNRGDGTQVQSLGCLESIRDSTRDP